MSDPNQQKDINDEIIANFSAHNHINVDKAGDDNYRITYNIQGLIKENDTVSIGSTHVILIRIPFGYPLFAPNCQSISPTFHPDFTPSTIFLGEFWNPDKTFTQLIEYLGEMIQGIHYSTENTLNKEAYLWYKENNSDLPLPQDKLEQILDEENEIFDPDKSILSLELDSNTILIDDEFDDQHLIELLQENNFYQLDKALKDIPIGKDFPSRQELQAQTEEALYKAEHLLKKATNLESKLEHIQACEIYKQAKVVVADLFGVDDNISRLDKIIAIEELNSLGDKNSGETENEIKRKFKKHTISLTASPKYFVALGICLLGFLTLKAYESYSDIQNAQSLLNKCHELIEKQNYHSAKSSCESAIRISNNSNFIFSFLRDDIGEDAQKTLASEHFTKGLSGKILVNGIWIDKTPKNNLSPFQTLVLESKTHLKKGNLAQAKSIIANAKLLATSQEEKELAAKTLLLISFTHLSEKAYAIYKEKGCEEARSSLIQAKEEGGRLSAELQKRLLPPINSLLTECKFNQLITDGNTLYNSSDWQKAIPLFHQALIKLQDSSVNTNLSASAIKEKISKSKIYLSIDNANHYFSAGEWQNAIDTYKHAIKELKKQNISQINISKLQRIALEAQIILGQQKAKRAEQNNNFNEAIKEYDNISSLIQKSSISNDQELTKIIKKIPKIIRRLQSHRFIEDKKLELIKKHTVIFTTNYPAASAETLSEQRVIYLDQIGSVFTYKLLATDRSSGRSMTLVIFYEYNQQTGKWKFAKPRKSKKQ